MTEDPLPYDEWIEDAFREVIKRALDHAQSHGLPGEHHFYITFRTGEDGVRISKALKAQYPETMTIVLQHQYQELSVEDDLFSVSLRFNGKPERLRVPFMSVTAFNDPSVNFGIQLRASDAANTDNDDAPPAEPAAQEKEKERPPADGDAGTPAEKVVALDTFRKK